MPHLPYAYHDDDEFLHPSGDWLLLDRAITLDNWLFWRHALPVERSLRKRLTAAVASTITLLAEELHAVHQRLPDYRQLGDSPFRVSRWWDPGGEDGWETGGACLFRIEGHSSSDILACQGASPALSLRAASGLFVEAALLSPAGQPLGRPSPPQSARSAGTSRQSRSCRTPPAGTPDPAPPAPGPARGQSRRPG